MTWRYFSADEMRCRCGCGRLGMQEAFMVRLDDLRAAFGRPLYVNSGYRCGDHNARTSRTGRDGPHTTGRAADLSVYGSEAYRIVALAPEMGFTGIGIHQTGPRAARFVHVDTLTDGPRPWVWSY